MQKLKRIVIAVPATIVIISIAVIVWENHRDKIVISRESAGIAETAKFLPGGFWDEPKTKITTDKGTFLVDGTFQLFKGDELFIDKCASGRRCICDHKNNRCKKFE
jgi:hypothetical protein